MTERTPNTAEIILITGTRVVLGIGIGLLLAGRLNKDQRKAAGVALALFAGLTTIPLALGVVGKKRPISEIRAAA
jgi:hypothetical protein